MYFLGQRQRQRLYVVTLLLVIMSFVFLMQWQRGKDRIQDDLPIFQKGYRKMHRRYITQQFPKRLVFPTEAFEPDVLEDIQTISAERPRIPHIIHFIFITDLKGKSGIPAIYKSNVKSFADLNPKWTYFFWTETSARQLIATKYPGLLSTWDSYKKVINKADALRYVVLHEFGGVYTDLDMQCKRSLDRATMKYACILTPEPFEHSSLLYRAPFHMSNGFMMCRPNHPFMKQLILSLPHFAKSSHIVEVAGPVFLTIQYRLYNEYKPGDFFQTKLYNESNSPYFYQGTLREDHINAIYVANTHYFMKSIDFGANLRSKCNKSTTHIQIVKRGCNLLKNSKITNKSYSYTDHFWRHMYSISSATEMIPVTSAITEAKLKKWQPTN